MVAHGERQADPPENRSAGQRHSNDRPFTGAYLPLRPPDSASRGPRIVISHVLELNAMEPASEIAKRLICKVREIR